MVDLREKQTVEHKNVEIKNNLAEALVWHLLQLAVLESEAKLLLNISESPVQCLWDPRPQMWLVWYGDANIESHTNKPLQKN